MRLNARAPQKRRLWTTTEFDRWYNGGRRIKKTDKECALRSRYITFAKVQHRFALYGPNRGA